MRLSASERAELAATVGVALPPAKRSPTPQVESPRPTRGRSYPLPPAPEPEPVPAGPNAEQWKAVRDGLERFFGKGRYQWVGGQRSLPPGVKLSVVFDMPDMDRAEANAEARFAKDGRVTIVLRSDRTPDEIKRSLIHELQHVVDYQFVMGGSPDWWLDNRADDTARHLMRL